MIAYVTSALRGTVRTHVWYSGSGVGTVWPHVWYIRYGGSGVSNVVNHYR